MPKTAARILSALIAFTVGALVVVGVVACGESTVLPRLPHVTPPVYVPAPSTPTAPARSASV